MSLELTLCVLYTSSLTALCGVLPDIDNGRIEYSPDTTAPYDVSTVATYLCDEGYELTLNPGSQMRTCVDNGDGSGASFDGTAPTCERKLS